MIQILPSLRSIRLLLLIVFVNGCLSFSLNAAVSHQTQDLEKRITISFDKISLKEALDKIANKASVVIIYSNSRELTTNSVSIDVKNKPLKEVLNNLLSPFPLSYRVIDDKIVVTHDGSKLKPLPPKNEQSVITPIKGKVTDASGQVLQGATIRVKGENNLAITDKNGEFAFDNISPNSTLQVSFIGYKTKEIAIGNISDYLTITLEADDAKLEVVSIVSTGYQILPKERATGSFAQVDNQLLNRRVSTDVFSRLEGVVPGLIFNRNTNNSAGGGVDINIRGHSTLFANDQPLVVVDNFPYDGDINNINPNDIQNVTILKDAAAASIWGVRSGNGVIVITTKKARRNQELTAEVNANLTIGQKPDLYYSRNFIQSNDFINIEQDLFNRGYYNSAINTGYTPVTPVVQILSDQKDGKISASGAASQIDALRGYDVRKDLTKYFYQPTINQQYAVNLKGGNSNSDYFLSLGDDQNRSFAVGNNSGRITINSNLNYYPVRNLQFSLGINYIKTDNQSNNAVNFISLGTNGLYPYARLVDANGNAMPIAKDYSLNYTNNAKNGFLDWSYRPFDELHNADNKVNGYDNIINLGVQYDFLKHFMASVKYRYEKANTNLLNYNSLDSYYTRNLINRYTQPGTNGTFTFPIPVGGILQQSNSFLTSQRARGQLNYSNGWSEMHEFTAIVGTEISDVVNDGNSDTAYGYNKDNGTSFSGIDYSKFYSTLPTGSAKVPTTLGFGKTTDHYISYFSNAAYTYKGKYILSASGRIDKSNLFGVSTNQKSVPLYSAGLAWNLSKEGFYAISWLPNIKLRATYGYTGNINKNATAVTTIKQASNSIYSGIPYSNIASPGNPELRWEKVRMINIGLDYGFKNNTVSGSIEYYSKKGIDLFGNSPLAPSTGLTTFFGNTADTKGNGLDIVINTKNINSKDFQWNTSILFSRAIDVVANYDVTQTAASYITTSNASTILPLAGKSLFGLYSYKWGGLTHNTGNPQGFLNGQLSTDYSKIISGTSVNDMIYNGSSRPTIFGSFRNTFSYRNFSLSLNIIYKFNYYFRRTSYGSSSLPFGGNADYYNRWQKPGDELTTQVPSQQYPPYNGNRDVFYGLSSALVEKGDHIRLQDISLSYELIKSKNTHIPFSHVQIYSYINNVGILWRANKYGIDPDLSTNSTQAAYPIPRTISLGLKANF